MGLVNDLGNIKIAIKLFPRHKPRRLAFRTKTHLTSHRISLVSGISRCAKATRDRGLKWTTRFVV